MNSYAYNVRKYFAFNAAEIKALVVSILAMTFIVAFNDGNDVFNLYAWGANFLLWLVIVTVSMLFKMTVQRLVSIGCGFRLEYKLWWYGILFGVLFTIVTNGHLWLLIPGGVFIHILAFQRVGQWRYGTNFKQFMRVGMFGPFASIMLAMIIKALQVWFHVFPADSIVVANIVKFNIWFAIMSMIPIPPLDGSRVIWRSRVIYAMVLGAVMAYSLTPFIGWYALLLGVVCGIGALVWHFTKE